MTSAQPAPVRIRVVEFVIQPVIMAANVETLTPSPCQPVTVPGHQVANFPPNSPPSSFAEEERMNETG
jgi:hypothetical protein